MNTWHFISWQVDSAVLFFASPSSLSNPPFKKSKRNSLLFLIPNSRVSSPARNDKLEMSKCPNYEILRCMFSERALQSRITHCSLFVVRSSGIAEAKRQTTNTRRTTQLQLQLCPLPCLQSFCHPPSCKLYAQILGRSPLKLLRELYPTPILHNVLRRELFVLYSSLPISRP